MKLAFLLQFISRWKTFTSRDIGCAMGWSNVDVSQKHSLIISNVNIRIEIIILRFHQVMKTLAQFNVNEKTFELH